MAVQMLGCGPRQAHHGRDCSRGGVHGHAAAVGPGGPCDTPSGACEPSGARREQGVPRGSRRRHSGLHLPALRHGLRLDILRTASHLVHGRRSASHHPLPQPRPVREWHASPHLAGLPGHEHRQGEGDGFLLRPRLRRARRDSLASHRSYRSSRRTNPWTHTDEDHVCPACEHLCRDRALDGLRPVNRRRQERAWWRTRPTISFTRKPKSDVGGRSASWRRPRQPSCDDTTPERRFTSTGEAVSAASTSDAERAVAVIRDVDIPVRAWQQVRCELESAHRRKPRSSPACEAAVRTSARCRDTPRQRFRSAPPTCARLVLASAGSRPLASRSRCARRREAERTAHHA